MLFLTRYYFAIPPNVFLETAASIKQVGLSSTGFTRLVVEKRECLQADPAREAMQPLSCDVYARHPTIVC